MQRRRSLILSIFILLSTTFVSASGETERFQVTANQIAQTLLLAGVSVDPADIDLPLPLSTAVPAPHLALAGSNLVGDTRLRVRLSCTVQGECLPFFVLLDLHDKHRAAAGQSILNPSLAPALPPQPARTVVVRAGGRAVLLLENSHTQITLPVIAIDTGTLGADVRVASLDRKQTYRGLVIEEGVVRGVLP